MRCWYIVWLLDEKKKKKRGETTEAGQLQEVFCAPSTHKEERREIWRTSETRYGSE
jgi:hypothetical protein